MKVKLEDKSIKYRGVVLRSETEEEKKVLRTIWNLGGGPVAVGRLDDGFIELVVAPTPDEDR